MANKISIKDFKSNNLLITILILGLFLALFFLPEMLGLGINPATSIKEGLNFDLANVLNLDSKNKKEKKIVEETDRKSLKVERDGNNGRSKKTDLTWSLIKSRKTKKEFNQAKSRSINFANSLSDKYQNTKFKLFDYSNGIDFMLSRGQEMMSPLEALDYIDRLEQNVTNSLNKENSSRDNFLRWSNIATIESLKNVNKIKGKVSVKKSVPKFAPKILFKEIEFARALDNRSGYRINKNEFVFWPTIYYKGNDVTRFVDIYRNGDLINRIKGKKVGDKDSDWYQLYAPKIKNGIITIVLKSKDNQTYSKSYKFKGNLPQFDWKRHHSKNLLKAKYRYTSPEKATYIERSLAYKSKRDNSGFGNLVSVSSNYGNLNSSNVSYSTF